MTPTVFLTLFLMLSLSFRFVRLIIAIRKSHQNGRGRLSARPIFWVMTFSYLLYVAFCAHEGLGRVSVFSVPMAASGLFLFIGALVLREVAMRDLGRYFSPNIEIRQEHRLIREGLYRTLRHPLLLCMALEIVGMGLVLNAPVSLCTWGVGFYFPLIVIRQKLEERRLIESLGDAYRIYQREVGAFWPRVNR